VVEQRDMVNPGVRGTKQERRPTSGPGLGVSNFYPIMFKCLVPANYSNGTPKDLVASGSSLVLPRAAAGTRGQHRALAHCTMQELAQCAIPCKGSRGQRGAHAGEEGRMRDEGTGERAKEVARTVCGKATGAWMIGERGRRR
jgi:hypothetical protein